ncbi:MAG: hypothetical protein IKP20_00835 [Candidatus Methanomethylophilaceae archaeon]|nr:hypothetical protein [Candidatus Methanomethylophilaceae archaeon]
MSDESYRKCMTCRLCRHLGEKWECIPEGRATEPTSSCGRYRPGCCEACASFVEGKCMLTGRETYDLDVCQFYDPSGLV